MHICFILENSLTMLQKSSASELCIFDQIKTSLELVIKNILKSWSSLPGQESTDVIHLFVTSSTEPISSYTDNHEIHIIHQVFFIGNQVEKPRVHSAHFPGRSHRVCSVSRGKIQVPKRNLNILRIPRMQRLGAGSDILHHRQFKLTPNSKNKR